MEKLTYRLKMLLEIMTLLNGKEKNNKHVPKKCLPEASSTEFNLEPTYPTLYWR